MSTSIDSQILSFLLKRNPPGGNNPDQDVVDLYRRSRILINELKYEKSIIILSSIVVSELLIGIEPKRHADFIAEIQDQFTVVPFDVRAMALAADLWTRTHKVSDDNRERKCIRADTLIVASAKVGGARIFYSHDKDCRKIAERAGMVPKDLPEASKYLFDVTGDREEDSPPGKKPKKRRRSGPK